MRDSQAGLLAAPRDEDLREATGVSGRPTREGETAPGLGGSRSLTHLLDSLPLPGPGAPEHRHSLTPHWPVGFLQRLKWARWGLRIVVATEPSQGGRRDAGSACLNAAYSPRQPAAAVPGSTALTQGSSRGGGGREMLGRPSPEPRREARLPCRAAGTGPHSVPAALTALGESSSSRAWRSRPSAGPRQPHSQLERPVPCFHCVCLGGHFLPQVLMTFPFMAGIQHFLLEQTY